MVSFEEWWEKHKMQVWNEFKSLDSDRRAIALEVIAENAWQASAEATRKQVVGECVEIIQSLPCVGCKLKDGSHFSDCPKYNEEDLIEQIMELEG